MFTQIINSSTGADRLSLMTEDIKRKLHHFFPGEKYSPERLAEDLATGDLLNSKEAILPYLQTALLDEKVIEVQLDGMPMVYFSRLKDDISADEEAEGDGPQPELTEGRYLTAMHHLITLPLEPGLGNLHLRYSRAIILRMFTNNFAVEMATTFEDLVTVDDIPVLRLSFPELARIAHNVREFRAKVPDSLHFIVALTAEDDSLELEAVPVNISIRGMAFAASKKEQRLFKVNSLYSLKFFIDDELLLRIDGTVRHLSRLRKRSGIEYICGLEFEPQTKTQAAVIESIVAMVQRAHLKELSEKSYASGVKLIT